MKILSLGSTHQLSKEFRHATVALCVALPFALAACTKNAPEESPLTDEQAVQGLCLYGCPAGAPTSNRTVDHAVLVLSNNGQTKFADWVAYRITRECIGPTRDRNWHADPDLPKDETLRPSDYKGIRAALNADRGHQAPLASLTGCPGSKVADYLSNITPQAMDLNAGAWERLEEAERKLAKQPDVETVYSITGPLYERAMPKLPRAHLDHTVPSGYWKIVAIRQNGQTVVAAFIMDQNTPRRDNFCAHTATMRDVESRARLNFFPGMPQPAQEQIETAKGALLPALGCPG